MTRTIQGIEQGRADYAYECAKIGISIAMSKDGVKYNNDFYYDENYKSYVKSFPMMIKNNGFGATIAFVYSKKAKIKEVKGVNFSPGSKENPKNAYDLIYFQIHKWLNNDENSYLLGDNAKQELSLSVIELTSGKYRAVTNEILALFNWLRRFAEGLSDGE